MKNILKTLLLLLILTFISFLSIKTYKLETSNRILKRDITELSDIKYGLFNVDVWKTKIGIIIGKKIEELKITEDNKEENREKISKLLEKIINDFENNYKENNRKKSLFGISLKNIGSSIFSIFKEFKNEIPNITEKVLNFLEDKENRDEIKNYIISKLDNYANETFQKVDYSEYNRILRKHSSNSLSQAITNINIKKNNIEGEILKGIYFMIFLFLLCIYSILQIKQKSNLDIVIYSLIAVNFLILGISLPMIDIDARIKLMEFQLLGENVLFKNQILYFKSKSIIEMVRLMLSQGEIKVILVGLLVLIFSVIFPMFKIISTISILYIKKLRSNIFIEFMVFKSGKWSMADVMVVAIFMSYIGFSGIISNQLSELEKVSSRISILTTNDSDLENGFFFFTGFVIFGISISQMIFNKMKKSV